MSASARGIKVMIMAGGTGGHVFPALALARELRSRQCQVEWLGTSRGIEARVVPADGFQLNLINVVGVRGKGISAMLKAPWRIAASLREAFRVLKRFDPDVVVGLGGYVAGPGGVAARLLGKPLIIHEQNARPGTTNRLLAKLANRVLAGFPDVFNECTWVGNPVREEISAIASPETRMDSRAEAVKILVLGGSLGAQALNEMLPKAIQGLPDKSRLQLRHQTGERHYENTQTLYRQTGIDCEVVAFIEDMADALAWADLVICRAGALTIAELCAAGVASILVPFPFAIDDHQTANGEWLVRHGAAVLFQQHTLSAEVMQETIMELIQDRSRLLRMALAARQLAKPDATTRFADICFEAAR